MGVKTLIKGRKGNNHPISSTIFVKKKKKKKEEEIDTQRRHSTESGYVGCKKEESIPKSKT